MKPWMIERMERQRRERTWKPEPLRLPLPQAPAERPPERAERPDPDQPERGVWIYEM